MGFFELAILIRGPRKNLFISMRPSNSLLTILKDILKLKIGMKSSASEPIRSNEGCNICCFSNMFSNKRYGKWQWRHLNRGACQKLKNFIPITSYFCTNIWIQSRDPVPLSSHPRRITVLPQVIWQWRKSWRKWAGEAWRAWWASSASTRACSDQQIITLLRYRVLIPWPAWKSRRF